MLGFLHTDVTKRFDMDAVQLGQLLESTLSLRDGKIDALTEAVAAMLEAGKGNPDIATALSNRLDAVYSDRTATTADPLYLQGFDSIRKHLLSVV
jgi:hypothetical protein